ncbi:hypothetical protein BT69DRAFT_1212576 [Atractiella rhizophila]|nr:hypothetical protein BT69DRAFT_1212576 [Atractiella rhizophila]
MEDECLEYVGSNHKAQLEDWEAAIVVGEHGEDGDFEFTSLPSSVTGSRKWAMENVADALAIAKVLGRLNFFVTATANPNWPKMKSQLRPGQSATEGAWITTHIFKARLTVLLEEIKKQFGGLLYKIHVIEFQK